MDKPIRIGTRESQLALWQAHKVQALLQEKGISSEIVSMSSAGDLSLDQPLYEMGIIGVFTKILDVALLKKEIDVAVHSYKDVPTAYPKGIVPVAVLERACADDILVYKKGVNLNDDSVKTIATGSLRRQAFWADRFPKDQFVDLRGNVQTRIKKLVAGEWHGAIFAYAGLDRSGILSSLDGLGLAYERLNWMVPAPAQGAILVVALEENKEIVALLAQINNEKAEKETSIERAFLRKLEGGCSTPLGAKASLVGGKLEFKAGILTVDGTEKVVIEEIISADTDLQKIGEKWAIQCLLEGGDSILEKIKHFLDERN